MRTFTTGQSVQEPWLQPVAEGAVRTRLWLQSVACSISCGDVKWGLPWQSPASVWPWSKAAGLWESCPPCPPCPHCSLGRSLCQKGSRPLPRHLFFSTADSLPALPVVQGLPESPSPSPHPTPCPVRTHPAFCLVRQQRHWGNLFIPPAS